MAGGGIVKDVGLSATVSVPIYDRMSAIPLLPGRSLVRLEHSPLNEFHPAVARWFGQRFAAPTAAQAAAWPSIHAGQHTLVAAPTGSGKTLTAFLAAIDTLVREGVAHGGALADATSVVYVSPLKALSNDVHVNLEEPLEGIRAELKRLGLPDVAIRTAVRTGDTTQAERSLLRKQPPHILVTTPESLYVLLGSASGRAMLGGAHGDRRRDPRHRRQQARLASVAVARTASVAVPARAVADRVVSDAEAHRENRRLPGRLIFPLSRWERPLHGRRRQSNAWSKCRAPG